MNNMGNEIWVKRFHSFKDAETEELYYYASMTPEERLSIVQLLREEYWKFKGPKGNESRKRLSRVFKVVKQAQG